LEQASDGFGNRTDIHTRHREPKESRHHLREEF